MKFELDLMDAKRDGIEEGFSKGREAGIRGLVKSMRQVNFTDADITKSLVDSFHLTTKQAQQYIQHYS